MSDSPSSHQTLGLPSSSLGAIKLDKINPYVKYAAKAIFAGAVAGISAAVGVIDDGLTTGEVLLIVGAVLIAARGTFIIENGAKP